jgi:hypothetical protein
MLKRSVAVLSIAVAAAGTTPALASARHDEGPRSVSIAQGGTQYLADVAPFTVARTAFQAEYAAWYTSHGSPSSTAHFAAPFVTASHTFEKKLLSQGWPSRALPAAHALAGQVSVVANDVARLASLSSLTIAVGEATLERDSTVSSADADKLRADLGLPPAT